MTSMWSNNWDDPQLNNFRQNVPGSANGQAIGDTTAGASTIFSCEGSTVTLSVDVCNRGALAIPQGVPVGFYVGNNKICTSLTSMPLFPGECEQVQCVWNNAPVVATQAVDVTVIADDGNSLSECKEGNNTGGIFDVHCQPPS